MLFQWVAPQWQVVSQGFPLGVIPGVGRGKLTQSCNDFPEEHSSQRKATNTTDQLGTWTGAENVPVSSDFNL